MKKSLTFFFLMWMASGVSYARPARETSGAFVQNNQAAISVTFFRPLHADDVLVEDNVRVVLVVSSTFEVARVEVSVEGRKVNAVLSPCEIHAVVLCLPGWVAELSLAGLARGEKTLTATAVDVHGNTAPAQRRVIYDRTPVVTINAPLEGTVARPGIFIEAACGDDDPAGCTSLTVRAALSDRILAQGKDSVHGFVSIPESDGRQENLVFTALDSRGQTKTLLRGIFVESSGNLSEVETVSGEILDVQPDRILFLEANRVVKIRDRATGAESVVINNPARDPRAGFLTPKGAIFWAQILGSNLISPFVVYDWRDGNLIDLGLHGAPTLRVKGKYAIWSLVSVPGPPSLILRDLVSGTNTVLSDDAVNNGNEVAANGDVVYVVREPSSNSFNLYRFRGGLTTKLTSDSTLTNISPLTDGINVVYTKTTPCCNGTTSSIALYGPSGEATLSTLQREEPVPVRDYQVNGGWVAFKRPGTSMTQVWTRSPASEDAQVSFFSTPSSIEALSPLGGVVFSNANRSYLKETGQPAVEVGPEVGRYFWQDGHWLVTIGRTLFRVNTMPAPTLSLLTEEGTQKAIALNAVTLTRSPFSLNTPHNLSPDQRTRLMLLAANVSLMPGDDTSAVTAQAEDSQHRLFAVPVEYVGKIPNFDWLTQINVRLPEELQGPGEVWLSIIVRGEVSNRVLVTIE